MTSKKIYGVSSLFLSLILLLTVSCGKQRDWIRFRGEAGKGATSNAVHPPLGVKWKLRLQMEDNPTPSFNPPIVKGGTIFFGSPDGNFYALDIESGYMRWVFNTDGIVNSIPYADGENVYFGSNDGNVYAVSLEEGKEVWSFKTESTVQSTILRYKDIIVFASDGGSAYFLTPEGVLDHVMPNPVWHYNAFQVYEDVVYFAPGPASRPHSLGAYDLSQKAYIWVLNTASLRATWYSFPALNSRYLYFATCAYRGKYWALRYYAYNRETGELIWSYEDESIFGNRVSEDLYILFRQNLRLLDYMAPSLWKNFVIYTSGDSVVRAFHAKNGNLIWSRHFEYQTSSAPTIAGDRVYFGLRGDYGSPEGRAPRLVCLSARNGRKLWEMELDGALLSAPVIAGKWLIFGTDRNIFYVLEELY
jgi:outer membrane protein assembly factor BamB